MRELRSTVITMAKSTVLGIGMRVDPCPLLAAAAAACLPRGVSADPQLKYCGIAHEIAELRRLPTDACWPFQNQSFVNCAIASSSASESPPNESTQSMASL